MMIFWLIIVSFLSAVCGLVIWPLRQYYMLSSLTFVILMTVAVLLYWQWGGAHYYTYLARQRVIQQQLAKFHNIDDIVLQLKRTLRQHPRSARGWYLLGRLYLIKQDYPHAREAFAKASQLGADTANQSRNGF